jgi:chromosome segregation ATPase
MNLFVQSTKDRPDYPAHSSWRSHLPDGEMRAARLGDELRDERMISERYREEVERLASLNRKSQNRILELEATLETRRRELDRLRRAEKEWQTTQRALAASEVALHKARIQLQAVEAHMSTVTAERDLLLTERESLVARTEAQAAEIATLNSELAQEAQVESDSLVGEFRQALEEAVRQREEVRAYTQELLRMTAGLEAERNDLRQQVEQLKADLEAARRQPVPEGADDEIEMGDLKQLVR